jgi:cell division protein FtsZ
MSGMGVSMMGTGRAQGDERAAKAAQAAISSPLLEDVCLDGARGILVNITAGLDMGIHEFEEVGEVIRQFASDDATVVVGTVIDPEMSDEIRVTLVATGLEDDSVSKSSAAKQAQAKPRPALRPVQLEENIPQKIAVGEGRATSGRGVYEQRAGYESGVLDIPAFLRNQAD